MRKIGLLFLLLISTGAFAQDLIFSTLRINPVSMNPADIQKDKFTIGFPLLSSFRADYSNNGFKYNDFYKRRSDDSVVIDVNNLTSVLNKRNYLSASMRYDLLHFVYSAGDDQFSFNVTERVDADFSFPKELFELINKGNAAYIGQTVDLSDLILNLVHYREYSIGYARKITDNWTVGGRVKYLYGMDNIQTINNKSGLYTAPDDFTLLLTADYRINTSTIFNDEEIGTGKYLFGMGNRGVGLDLSANYNLDEKWMFSFMLLDFGKIKWTKAVKNYTTKQGAYEFRGINLNQFVSDSTDQIDDVLDSIGNSFEPLETSESYSAYLPYRIYATAGYKYNEKSTFNGVVELRHGAEKMRLAANLSYNRRLGKVFAFSVGNSLIYSKWINPGVGFNINLASFNIFFASDNIIGFFNPSGNFKSDFRSGIFFSW